MNPSKFKVPSEVSSQLSSNISDRNTINGSSPRDSSFRGKEEYRQYYHDLNPHVRIHPTEMQRYLHSLIQKNENNIEVMTVDASKDAKEESSDVDIPAIPTFQDTMATCMGTGDQSANKRQKPNPEEDALCPSTAGNEKSNNMSAPPHYQDSITSTTSTEKSDSSTLAQDISKSKKKRAASSDGKADNFKSVDVLHDDLLIARFLTQTECAAYLRATPEAVSYHCSKGGGVCNGLVIRPSQTCADPLAYGLFEGADKHRPKERPQLNKDAVRILKDWLLSPEHVGNPYPNQLETSELMKKTGLDKLQLKHWFNNARKRILKPFLKENAGASAQGIKVKKKHSQKNSKATINEASAFVSQTSSSLVHAPEVASHIPLQDDGPALTEIDERPRSGAGVLNQSLFSHADTTGISNSIMDALRNNTIGHSLGSGPLFAQSNSESMGIGMGLGLGLNYIPGGGMIGSSLISMNGYSIATGIGSNGDMNNGNGLAEAGSSLEDARSDAVFKQQVAAMAMGEANIAFDETEAAYSRAKDLHARSTYEKPEEQDPLVIEANAVARRCQSAAVFKLKVSQKANEEAAKAYASHHQSGDGTT
jgi:hypothetical protein